VNSDPVEDKQVQQPIQIRQDTRQPQVNITKLRKVPQGRCDRNRKIEEMDLHQKEAEIPLQKPRFALAALAEDEVDVRGENDVPHAEGDQRRDQSGKTRALPDCVQRKVECGMGDADKLKLKLLGNRCEGVGRDVQPGYHRVGSKNSRGAFSNN